MNSLNNLIKENAGIFAIGVLTLIFLLLVFTILLLVSHRRLSKLYKKFMAGENGKSLESKFISRFSDLDMLKAESNRLSKELDKVKENLLTCYQKVGVVKYDAFREMGGKLSFVLVLLDKENNGFMINSVHSSREGCYTYLKEIIKGESFIELSTEEKSALEQAINSGNYLG
ncbi:MAG: DUF4446 family protein [Clostridiales bacterium]|nr:DUF4446 family protein [Clostridiales bacterium]